MRHGIQGMACLQLVVHVLAVLGLALQIRVLDPELLHCTMHIPRREGETRINSIQLIQIDSADRKTEDRRQKHLCG